MARVNAQQWLAKWSQNLNAAGPYITAGVDRVTTAPGQAAAAAQDRMLANITASITSGQWAKRVAGVTLDQWKTSMKSKGIPRISQGTAAAVANKQASIAALLNAVDASVATLASLPKGGLQNNINRAVAFMNAMSVNAPSKQG